MYRIGLYIIVLCLLPTGCIREELPDLFSPLLTLQPTEAITRTTAVLSADIELRGRGVVRSGHFIYASSPQFSDAAREEISTTRGSVRMPLAGLKAGCDYYYRLEVTNGYSVVGSGVGQFRTLPNDPPQVGAIKLIHKGPFSAAVECCLTDNGGEAPDRLGFLLSSLSGGEEEFISAERIEDSLFRIKFPDLEMATGYSVRAYASNSVGETFGELLEFATDNAIYTTIPGALPEIIGERQKYLQTEMSVAGKLNGTDLRFLRDMSGRDIDGNATPGRLHTLNLSDATIVGGGDSYFASRYSKADTLGYGAFAASVLQEIILPRSLKVIEKDAFLDCGSLSTIHIPEHVVSYTPSEGCLQLASFQVSPFNEHFKAEEGVLYDKTGALLIQYPEGKREEAFRIPAGVKALGDHAFLRASLDSLTLPATIEKLGAQVFRNARLKAVVLSDAIATIPSGTFQGCTLLRRITLGGITELIADYCFDQCTSLQSLYIRATLPPVCYSQTFGGLPDVFDQCILYVPAGSRNSYRQNSYWKNFMQIKSID